MQDLGITSRLQWDLEDPEVSGLGLYAGTRRARDQIRWHIEDFLQKHG